MTFFFYDVETSGTNPAYQRIMQFAGQRTDSDLKPLGTPINVLVKLSEDILPEPDAVLVHGITPQRAITEGLSEPEFLKLLEKEVFKPDTVVAGYNNIRFDDEFLRHTLWRNFYDPYEWQWKDGRSRWDLLDVVRMTRALRPEGMEWATTAEGRPTNRLTDITAANNIKLENAHDALSDIQATIELAKLIKQAQPKLFSYLLKLRDKRQVGKVIGYDIDNKRIVDNTPFLYTSGRYPSEHLHTTAAIALGPSPKDSNSVLVYDLRHDPRPFSSLGLKELSKRLFVPKEEREKRPPLPVKKLALNRSPAVSAIGVLDEESQKRINLKPETIEANLKRLAEARGFAQLVYDAYSSTPQRPETQDVEAQLYDGFINDKDKQTISQIRKSDGERLADWHPNFIDERLTPLLLRYKARNFPQSLSDKETIAWESWRANKLIEGFDKSVNFEKFAKRLQRLASDTKDETRRYLLEELQLYAESIAPPQLFDL